MKKLRTSEKTGQHSVEDDTEIERYNREREEANHAWRATVEGRYEEALAEYAAILKQRNRMNALLNRGFTHLLMGKCGAAEQDFQSGRDVSEARIKKLENEMVGVALWLQGKAEYACADWANEIARIESGEIVYTDGPKSRALLWWASGHLGLTHWAEVARKALVKTAKWNERRLTYWPHIITPFLLDQISAADLLAAGQKTEKPDQAAYMTCISRFYIGASVLHAGDLSQYRREMETVSQCAGITHAEYYLAKYELEHIPKNP